MEKIAFRSDGTKETGRKIIETLEKMGGNNTAELTGTFTGHHYWITERGLLSNSPAPTGYRILTIDQYEAEQAQKEPLDLTKILEGCEGVELYCLTLGHVTLTEVNIDEYLYPLIVVSGKHTEALTKGGRTHLNLPGECVLFPSFENRDWSTFKKPAKVVFTNCVGEVFTSEDKDNDVVVWWLKGQDSAIIKSSMLNLTPDVYAGENGDSDIFKSKKSLLLWMAEQEDKK